MSPQPQRLITPALRAAFKEYYEKRNISNKSYEEEKKNPHLVKAIPWDKEEATKKILKAFRKHKQAGNFQRCAGTFWLTWTCGIQTTHDEDNYWKGKILSRRQKDGTWKMVE